MDQDALLLALLIFALRVFNNAMGTVRVITLTNGHRGLATLLAFLESLIFAYTASKVLTDLDNIPNLAAYSIGFAVGGYIGMIIEEHFVTGYMTVNIVAADMGHEIALELRDKNYGVTETRGEGASGEVSMLRVVVHRSEVGFVVEVARKINREAFITVEEARAVHRGWMRARTMRYR